MSSDQGPLELTSILTGSLPLTLLTDAEPEYYVVEAVFNRRVEPEETALLLSSNTEKFLREHGYPKVHLTISDRRLVIAGSNLKELKNGLASIIGQLLADISTEVAQIHTEQDKARAEENRLLRERTQAVAALVESIDFTP